MQINVQADITAMHYVCLVAFSVYFRGLLKSCLDKGTLTQMNGPQRTACLAKGYTYSYLANIVSIVSTSAGNR